MSASGRELWREKWSVKETSDDGLAARTAGADLLIAGLEQAGAERFLGHAAVRREWFLSLSVNDYELLLADLNAILRNRPVETGSFTVTTMTVGSWVAPRQDDRRELIRETLETAQSIARDTSVDDGEALARAAVLVAGALNFIHSFADGNGRTARVVSYLLAEGWAPGRDERLREIAISRSSWATNPIFMAPDLLRSLLERHGEPGWASADITWSVPAVLDSSLGEALAVEVRDALASPVAPLAAKNLGETYGLQQPIGERRDGVVNVDLEPLAHILNSATPARRFVEIAGTLRHEMVSNYINTTADELTFNGIDSPQRYADSLFSSARDYVYGWNLSRTPRAGDATTVNVAPMLHRFSGAVLLMGSHSIDLLERGMSTASKVTVSPRGQHARPNPTALEMS